MGFEKSNNIRIARNSIYMGFRMIIVLIINLYTTRIILRELGVEDYGIFNVVCGFVSMFTFLSSAMANGIQRFYNYEFGKNGEIGLLSVYRSSIVVQIFVALIICALAETIGLWYLNNKMVIPPSRLFAANSVFQCSITSFVIIIIQVPFSALVIAKERMGFYAIMSVLNASLSLIIVFAIQISPIDKLTFYGILYVLVQFITFICYILYCKNLISIRLTKGFNRNIISSIVSFSGWNVLGTFSHLIKEQGINVLLNFFGGPIINAARGIAMQVNSGFQGLVANLSVPTRPQVTQSYSQGDYNRVINLTFSISKLSCILLFMFSYPVLLELDYILYLWLGDNIPDHTNSFIIIIVLTTFLNNLNSAISGVVHSSGKMKLYQCAGCTINLLSLPLAFMLLKNGCRPESALWVVFCCMIISQTAALIILKTIIHYSILQYIKLVIRPFLIVILVSFFLPYILHCTISNDLLRFSLVTVSSFAIVSGATYWFGLNSKEKDVCGSLLLRLRKLR